jgi:hypothetical protein
VVGQRGYILATGRRLPYLYVVGFDAALDPANDRTSKAILSRRSLMAPKPDVCRLGELIYPLA